MEIGNAYVVPRNETGSVPRRFSRRDDWPFSYASIDQQPQLNRPRCAREKLFHTVDVRPKSEVGMVGKRLGDIRVGARDISVFLLYY